VENNDLAALRDGFAALDGLLGADVLRPEQFLPQAWARGAMPRGGATVQLGVPWLRSGCSESYRHLAAVGGAGEAPALGPLLAFLTSEPRQQLNYTLVTAEGARLAYPTLRGPYVFWSSGGGRVECSTSPVTATPDPRQVNDAVAIARLVKDQLAAVALKHKVTDYGDGPDVDGVVYFTLSRGGQARQAGGRRSALAGAPAQGAASNSWIGLVATRMTARQPLDDAAMAGYLTRPEGLLVGELGIYAPSAPPPTPTSAPGLVLGPNRLFLPYAEVLGQPGPYRAYAVLWHDDGTGRRVWLVQPDGSLLDAAQVSQQLGIPVAFEPLAASDPTVASEVWAEQGSKKICWKIDGVKGCINVP
jgi:hypothetical protein